MFLKEDEFMPNLSFIIPVYNEEESLSELFFRINDSCEKNGYDNFEIVIIDDGSTDSSVERIKQIIRDHPDKKIDLICHRKNFGKAAALQSGFDFASGDIAVTMDADLQDDPYEVPKLLEKLGSDNGCDIVSGWKKVRHDPVEKRLPSKLFNFVTAKLSGIPIHDFNCGFKAYKKIAYKNINVYGEMHRYIPIFAKRLGFTTAEVPVNHYPRKYGHSKYGTERYLRGLFDSMTSSFLLRYGDRPMHFFGRLGLLSGLIGFAICLILVFEWIRGNSIGTRPLLTLGVLLITIGVLFFAVGLSSEMMLDRIGQRGKKPAQISEVIEHEKSISHDEQ